MPPTFVFFPRSFHGVWRPKHQHQQPQTRTRHRRSRKCTPPRHNRPIDCTPSSPKATRHTLISHTQHNAHNSKHDQTRPTYHRGRHKLPDNRAIDFNTSASQKNCSPASPASHFPSGTSPGRTPAPGDDSSNFSALSVLFPLRKKPEKTSRSNTTNKPACPFS